MTEVGAVAGDCMEMSMFWRSGRELWRGWTCGYASPQSVSRVAGKICAAQDEAAAGPLASGTTVRNAVSPRIAARRKLRGRMLLRSAVLGAPYRDEITQKIIGRTFCSVTGLRGPNHRSNHVRFAFAMLHQPARKHGGAIFFNPLIDQRGNFLSQIRSVTEPREFITLEAVS